MPSAKPFEEARVKIRHALMLLNICIPELGLHLWTPKCSGFPKEMGPASKPAKMHVERSEMLNLIQRWDSLGACTIIPLETKDFAEAVGIFTVDKDAFYFRLIINPKAINSCMASLSYITKELTPGSMLSLLSLKPGDMFRFFVLMTT